jgi:hypothetical protein
MTFKTSNISLRKYKIFLNHIGCRHNHDNGDHEIWHLEGAARPIVLQSQIDPVPEFIVKQHMAIIGITKKKMEEVFKNL